MKPYLPPTVFRHKPPVRHQGFSPPVPVKETSRTTIVFKQGINIQSKYCQFWKIHMLEPSSEQFAGQSLSIVPLKV
jgi:hypothetical protein